MPTSKASVATGNASRYLQQLCRHWSHRFEVSFDPQQGRIGFGEGEAIELTARPDTLDIAIEAGDPARLPELNKVVEAHIVRYAFRETLEFNWS
ncbi:DUF2218 domain-containing protein [Aquamicrobium defluvii]|uniref:2,4-dihydroxyhept-2-ene-1,7-dioic acid aldolase n=1 Tax=Aquamicrobium defluvii TaxID=69279 RepID=A0A011TWZ5_9HYPH|nr:DUF2218 domain-containing protein [Aquamicrobium defluvii]EXL08717.1 hypothetical protein BG36_04125 [Aquamicrobium defluvii]EZQ14771.1 hypothetical protein CF98_14280 [Halopseudomonas bauzanensis]TDR37469.1 hypothetical protein DES43_10212 [Aquamicrobium defluvii]